MPLSPPPPPLSKDEFDRRYKPGMSIYDVDPALAQWCRQSDRWIFCMALTTLAGIVLIAVLLAAIFS